MVKTARRIGTGTSDITEVDIERVTSVLRSGRLSAGPMMAEFEQAFGARHGARFASMCNSGTGALQMALQALKERYLWPDGAEVIVPAMTFVATINVVLFNNLKPVLVDIDHLTYTMDPLALERAITPNTVAVIPVHLFGQPADMTSIMDIARRNELCVVEDSCEAVGVTHRGKPVGSFGDFGCFSTYMAHLVTTGVGGLAITNDSLNARRFASLMNHGRNPIYTRIDDDDDLSDEQLVEIVRSRYEFTSIGQSFRVTEMEAALGLGQLERLDGMLAKRRQVAAWLTDALADEDLQLPSIGPGNEHAWMMYPLVVERPGRRDRIVVALERAGVETRYLMPILDQPCYRGVLDRGQLPVAQRYLRDGFYIGCHQDMTEADVDYIADVIFETE